MLPDVAIGAVIAAAIAGLASLLTLIISKENKTSEFREAWVNALRDDIAIMAGFGATHFAVTGVEFSSQEERWKSSIGDLVALQTATMRIRLRLNDAEKESLAVLGALDEMENIFNLSKSYDFSKVSAAEEKLIRSSRVLLKKEWVRVRQGEPVFRLAKICSFLVILMCLAGLGVYAWNVASNLSQKNEKPQIMKVPA